jgi:MFS family permease
LAVSALTVLLYVGLIYWLLPTADDLREGTLLRLAQCSLAATSVGVVTVLCTLAKRFAWPLCWRVLLRAGLAAGAVVGVVSLWQVDSLPSLAGKALSSGLLFVLFLTLMGELNKRDLDAVKRVIGGRK